MEFSHRPVMLYEAVDALRIKTDGIYVDATAGGGGHSARIASRLEKGRLISIDQDPDAIAALQSRFAGNDRVTIVKANFSELNEILEDQNAEFIDGILFDLGVSSHQFDTPTRGFSYHSDSSPINMSMSQEGTTAAELINSLPEKELIRILYAYGEEKFAGRIAREIVKTRARHPIETTGQLVEIIKTAIPAAARRSGGHPAKKTFQAFRIATNQELERLRETLEISFQRLNPAGRMALLSFHSLEDRIIKQYFKSLCEGCVCPPDFPVCTCGKEPRAYLPAKVTEPSQKEINENPRSRSAKLRVLEKIK